MSRRTVVAAAMASLLFSWPLLAQQEGAVGRSYTLEIQPGMTQDFEQGFRRHRDWHVQQNDPWSWDTYLIETGERMGQYVAVTSGHRWADFDSPPVSNAADGEHVAKSFGKYVAHTSSSVFTMLVDLSWPPTEAQIPMAQVLTFYLKPGMEAQFMRGIGKFREGATKINWGGRWLVFNTVSGEGTPAVVIAIPLQNWASMGQMPAGGGPDQVVEKAFGRAEAEAVEEMTNGAIRSIRNEIWTHRADLSSGPPMN